MAEQVDSHLFSGDDRFESQVATSAALAEYFSEYLQLLQANYLK